MKKYIRLLCVCAMFTALVCVATTFFSLPAGPVGNVNLGDVIIIITTLALGPYGAIASGIGAMLADLMSPYAIYAPATLIVKIALSLVCYYVYRVLKKTIKLDYLSMLIGAVCGELTMVLGYFLYEGILYGFATALLSVPFNLIQGGIALVVGTLISYFILKNNTVKKFIDNLK